MTTAERTDAEWEDLFKSERLLDQISDEHTRALDLHGWMIVPKPETIEPGEKVGKWPCDHPAPSWCEIMPEPPVIGRRRRGATRRVVEPEQALRVVRDRLTRAAASTSDEVTKRDLEALLFEVAAARPSSA